ncbi:MAG: hypothetical protein U0V72_04440 [Cytophagales bacterium]
MKKTHFIFFILYYNLLADNIYYINKLKESAENNPKNSLKNYEILVEKLKSNDASVLLNFGEILLQNKDTIKARGIYSKVFTAKSNYIQKSIALSQSALIEYKFNKNIEESINLLKKALVLDESNDIARNNLYFLYNLTSSNSEKQSTDQKRSYNASKSENQNQQSSSAKGEEQNTNEKPENNLTENQALKLLESMQKEEQQFIFQNHTLKAKNRKANTPLW